MIKINRLLLSASVLLMTPVLSWSVVLRSIQWSANGQRMLVVSDADARLFDAAGSELGRTSFSIEIAFPLISPDGGQFAYLTSDRSAWIHNLETGQKVRIFSQANALQSCEKLSWSGDGKRLAFSVLETSVDSATKAMSTTIKVYSVAADGSDKKLVTTLGN